MGLVRHSRRRRHNHSSCIERTVKMVGLNETSATANCYVNGDFGKISGSIGFSTLYDMFLHVGHFSDLICSLIVL